MYYHIFIYTVDIYTHTRVQHQTAVFIHRYQFASACIHIHKYYVCIYIQCTSESVTGIYMYMHMCILF